MSDGSLIFDTKLNSDGLKKGLSEIGKIAGKSFAAISAGVTAAGGAALLAGSNFETSFSKASTLFGDVSVDTENLNKKILEMSSTSGVAATELNETLYSAMSAGVPVTEDMGDCLDAVQQAVKLSKGGFTDSAKAIDVMTTASNAYRDAGYSMEAISDILITTQNKGKTTVDELASSLGKILPLASGYGMSLEDVGAAEATMTANGIATAEATTYLKSMLSELADGGSEVATILKEKTGMSFSECMASGMSLGDALGVIGESVDGDATAFSNLWSSSEAGVGALSILNTGTDQYAQTLDAMTNSAGATESAYSTMADTFETKKDAVVEGVKNLGVSIFEGLSDQAGGMLDVANSYISELQQGFEDGGVEGLITAFGNVLSGLVANIVEITPQIVEFAMQILGELAQALIDNIPTLIEAAGEIATAIVDGIGDACPALEPITDIFKTLIDNIDIVLEVLAPLIALWGAYQVICGVVTVAQTIMNAVMSANPIGIIITLVALLIGGLIALWNNCEGFRNAVKKIMDAISGFFKDAFEDIRKRWETAGKFFDNVWKSISKAFSKVGEFFSDTFNKAWDAICNAFSSVGDFFHGLWSDIVDLFTGVGESIGSAVGDAFKGAVNNVLKTIENVVNGFIGMINGVIHIINKIPGVELNTIDKLSLPRLAKGGVLKKGQVGLLEGDGDEAVIPLSQNREWIGNVAKELKSYGDQGAMFYPTQSIDYEQLAKANMAAFDRCGFKMVLDHRVAGRIVRSYV